MNLYLCYYSGSTIVGIGSPDPPQFIYDDEEYKKVFLSGMLFSCSLQVAVAVAEAGFRFCTCKGTNFEVNSVAEANFMTREANEWYKEPASATATTSSSESRLDIANEL